MKELAAIGAAGFIAMACVLVYMNSRVQIVAEVRPLAASPDMPTFKPVQ